MLMVKLELRVTLPAERVKGQRHLSFVSMDPSFSLAKLFSFKSTGFSVWLDQTRFYYFNLIFGSSILDLHYGVPMPELTPKLTYTLISP
jgi:hypothetical protein